MCSANDDVSQDGNSVYIRIQNVPSTTYDVNVSVNIKQKYYALGKWLFIDRAF